MMLLRVGKSNQEAPAITLDGESFSYVPRNRIPGRDYNATFFEKGGLDTLKTLIDTNCMTHTALRKIADYRIGPPVANPPNFICIGMNYGPHVEEVEIGKGNPNPELAVQAIREGGAAIFTKHTGCIIGPNDQVFIPRDSRATDYEVELGIVLKKGGHNIRVEDAHLHVAGFCVVNDYSERDWQLKAPSGQWQPGKGCPTFGPIGPYLVTPEAVDPDNLNIWLKVNGELRQNSNTSDMLWKAYALIAYLSKYYDLKAGDVITTGTPSGVALGMKPQVYLKDGDIVELGIDGLGQQKQVLVARS